MRGEIICERLKSIRFVPLGIRKQIHPNDMGYHKLCLTLGALAVGVVSRILSLPI
jgi:hypothetical protein